MVENNDNIIKSEDRRRRVEDAMRENRKNVCSWEGLQRENEEKEIGKRRGGWEKKIPKTRWKMQKGRDLWNGSKKMDGKC
jgi:hypothetical protein